MLARLARVFLVVALLAGWQAALQHPIEHLDPSHEAGSLCDAFAALTACAPDAARLPLASEQLPYFLPIKHQAAPRVAEAPPFLSQGPPAV